MMRGKFFHVGKKSTYTNAVLHLSFGTVSLSPLPLTSSLPWACCFAFKPPTQILFGAPLT